MERYANGCYFDVANENDILGIMEIEDKYFGKLAYKEEDIRKWMQCNSNMIYVVRNNEDKVIAFTIIAPITYECYEKFRNGFITDMNQFELTDICTTLQSDYYYFADVVSDNKNPIASMIIFKNILPILWTNAKYIVTTPVTDNGRNKAAKLGAKNIDGEVNLTLNESCYIDVSSAKIIAEKMVSIMDKALKRTKK